MGSYGPGPAHLTPSLPVSVFRLQLLKFPLGPCPRYEQLQNETRQTAEYQNESAQNAVSRGELEPGLFFPRPGLTLNSFFPSNFWPWWPMRQGSPT